MYVITSFLGLIIFLMIKNNKNSEILVVHTFKNGMLANETDSTFESVRTLKEVLGIIVFIQDQSVSITGIFKANANISIKMIMYLKCVLIFILSPIIILSHLVELWYNFLWR